MKGPRILLVNTHSAPDYHYGGVVESGSRIFKYLRRSGRARLATVSRNPNAVIAYFGGEAHCYRSRIFHRFAFSLDAILGLWRDVRDCDVALINGIFTFPVTLAQMYAVLQGKPFIVATRGGLEPWRVSLKKWKKIPYIQLVTLPLMRRAKKIHVTSKDEERTLHDLGFRNTVLIQNGIDADVFRDLPARDSYGPEFGEKFVFLFLSRTDREKGIDILLAAYRRFNAKFDPRKHLLVIAGPDHQGYLASFRLDYRNENIFRIEGAYGENKLKLIRRSDAVLLPSYSENFGNIVAEAMACARPVITTTGTPWREIAEVGCGRCVEPETEAFLAAMESVYEASESERAEMGARGRRFVMESFDWEKKTHQMLECIDSVAGLSA